MASSINQAPVLLLPARCRHAISMCQSSVLTPPLCMSCPPPFCSLPAGSTAPPLPVVLGCLLTPPRQADVDAALDRLMSLGALAVGGQGGLTPLGRHLAAMPLDAPLGKALIMGALLRCVKGTLLQRSRRFPAPPLPTCQHACPSNLCRKHHLPH